MTPDVPSPPAAPALEVVRYFLRLGIIAFGGPAAHIALMRRELVAERKWLTDEEFVDHLGVTNLIPGPNSTEMAMHMGAARAGWRGLWLGGLCFIGPAVLIVLALAWAYVEYGDTPTGEALLFGIAPVILAVVIQAIWGLRNAAIKGPLTALIVVAVVVLALLGLNEIVLILGSGVALFLLHIVSRGRANPPWPPAASRAASRFGALLRRIPSSLTGRHAVAAFPWMPALPALLPLVPAAVQVTPEGVSLAELFLVFLKIGGVLYGSGYVLVSFMQDELVDQRGWLTQQQLVDAIAIGQFTPGPVFSAATFAGYVIDRVPGALIASAGIFLPSFVFVTLTHPLVPRLRRSPWAAPFLDGVNAAAIALMAVVTIELARDALDSSYQLALLAIAAVVLVRFSPNSAWLVLAGAAAGILHALVT